jgi:adenosylcobinamide-GDP ribazoletransferase
MTTPYVRSGGIGSGLVGESRGPCVVALVLSALGCLFAGWHGARAVVVAALVIAWWRWVCLRRLGGMTGDTCGALTELTEMAVLIALAL